MAEEKRQYLLIGDDEKRERFYKIVDDRIKFLREHTSPDTPVNWDDIEHRIRVDTAERLGLILRW